MTTAEKIEFELLLHRLGLAGKVRWASENFSLADYMQRLDDLEDALQERRAHSAPPRDSLRGVPQAIGKGVAEPTGGGEATSRPVPNEPPAQGWVEHYLDEVYHESQEAS